MFEYSEKELDFLRQKDPKLGVLFDEFGIIERETFSSVFYALVFSICGQQISSKARISVVKKLKLKFGRICPKNIFDREISELRECGLSLQESTAIKQAAVLFHTKKLTQKSLANMDDAQFIKTLASLKGVGVWTAEMIMIFALKRPNIFSFSDFGIRKGLSILHNIKQLDKKKFERFRKLYSPYATIAAIYLWELANRN